jgi:hypothetical protein
MEVINIFKELTPFLMFFMGLVWLRYSERIKNDERERSKNESEKRCVINQLKWGLRSVIETQEMLRTAWIANNEQLIEDDASVYKERLVANYEYLLEIQRNPIVTDILSSQEMIIKFSSLMFMIKKETIVASKNRMSELNSNLSKVANEIMDNMKI